MKATAVSFVPKTQEKSRQKNKIKLEHYHHHVEQISDQLERTRIALQEKIEYVRAAQQSFREVKKEYLQAEKTIQKSGYDTIIFQNYEPSIKKHLSTMKDINQLASQHRLN